MDLKRAREVKGWTQQQLADRLGLARKTVIRCEAAGKLPRNKLVAAKYRKLVGL